MDFKRHIHDVPDFPKKGIVFKDITPLLSDAKTFAAAIDRMAEPFVGLGVQIVAGIESRGFLLATPIAYRLGAVVVPIRKKGKLPRAVKSASYALEYGTDSIEAHADAFPKNAKVLLVDDVLATGGTAAAAVQLIEAIGGHLVCSSFLLQLGCLDGRKSCPDARSPARHLLIFRPDSSMDRATRPKEKMGFRFSGAPFPAVDLIGYPPS